MRDDHHPNLWAGWDRSPLAGGVFYAHYPLALALPLLLYATGTRVLQTTPLASVTAAFPSPILPLADQGLVNRLEDRKKGLSLPAKWTALLAGAAEFQMCLPLHTHPKSLQGGMAPSQSPTTLAD